MTMGSFALFPARNWFEHLSQKPPAVHLYCLPYAGGSADIYRNWQHWFPSQIGVCLVHLPGRARAMRERPLTRLIPLVNAIADRLSGEMKVPYLLYGHSMGALIAFELAREMLRRHAPGPEHLLLSGRRAPQWATEQLLTYNLPRNQFLEELKRLNGTPKEVIDNPELIDLYINVLRADFELAETYEYYPGAPLPCPITIYGGLEDEDVAIESCYAWREQTSSAFKLRMFKGDHFFVCKPTPEFRNAFRADVLRAVPITR